MNTICDLFNMKSRMTGDCHVRFCGNVGVKFPRVTRFSFQNHQLYFNIKSNNKNSKHQ